MERILLWLPLAGALLGGVGARAQVGPAAGRARVYAVPATGEARRFEVPQVRLPDAAVARRINQTLLRHFRERSFGEIDSTLSPSRQLRLAARGTGFLTLCSDPPMSQVLSHSRT